MTYWKISFDSLMEIRQLFSDFIERCVEAIEVAYAREMRNTKDFWRSQVQKSYYLTGDFYDEKVNAARRDLEIWEEVQREKLQQIQENFTFFMDVIEFYEFSSKDFGKIVYLNFYKSTIEAVPSAKVPSNNFHYDTIGWNMNYKGTQVSLTYSNLILKFDKFVR